MNDVDLDFAYVRRVNRLQDRLTESFISPEKLERQFWRESLS